MLVKRGPSSKAVRMYAAVNLTSGKHCAPRVHEWGCGTQARIELLGLLIKVALPGAQGLLTRQHGACEPCAPPERQAPDLSKGERPQGCLHPVRMHPAPVNSCSCRPERGAHFQGSHTSGKCTGARAPLVHPWTHQSPTKVHTREQLPHKCGFH